MNGSSVPNDLAALLARIRACRLCAGEVPEPRPVLRAGATARLLVVGQAPGRRVHETGIPWNDPSGDRLRAWMGMGREHFYDESRIAIVPTAFCYPGTGKGGDLPPPARCAPTWHPLLRSAMPDIRLTLLIGGYAQAHYLGTARRRTLAETVAAWADYGSEFLPLPHPSPRNQRWFRLHPWFEETVLPELRRRLAELFDVPGAHS